MKLLWRVVLIRALCMLHTATCQSLLTEDKYAVDLRYQTIPGDDPILHFNVRTYVPESFSFEIFFNVTGSAAPGEPYSHSGSDSDSAAALRPEVEHAWHYGYQKEELNLGDVVFYWVKVKTEHGGIFRSIHNRAIIGQEAPTSLRNRQRTVATLPRPAPTSRATPPPPRPTTASTRPVVTHTLHSPAARQPVATTRNPGPRPPLPAPTTRQITTPVPRQFLPASTPSLAGVTTQPSSVNIHDLINCFQDVGFRNYDNCSSQVGRITRRPAITFPRPTTLSTRVTTERATRSTSTTAPPVTTIVQPVPTIVQPVPTTVQPVPTIVQPVPTAVQPVPTTVQPVPTTVQPVPTTVQPVTTTEPVDKDGSKNGNNPLKPGPGPKGGDLSGQQGKSLTDMDMTIVIVATVVPAVVMVGIIVIVTIIVKNRRGRTEPDPYQQVFNNMNYNSTMEIGARPGLPPPRTQFQKPTEETDYAYTDSHMSPDGEIYEAITHIDYELNGKHIKPKQPSMSSSQKSTTMTARSATEWGSDEYEDPVSPQRTSLKSHKSNMSTFSPDRPASTISPNPTYGMYQDPALNPRATLATTTVDNTVYSDTYQDPAIKHSHTLPSTRGEVPEHIYNDTYQDPEQSMPTSPPTADDETQQQYEIPGAPDDQSGPTRQYSALRKDGSGITLY